MNYTKAAARCCISRQAMRQVVQSIEQEYNVTLIQNHHNQQMLTHAGKRLCQRATPMLASLDILDEDLRAFAAIPSALRIGVLRTLAPFNTPALHERIMQLETCFPDIRCTVTPMDAERILDELHLGGLDAGILLDMNCIDGFERTLLQRDNVNILMAGEHPLAKKNVLSPAVLFWPGRHCLSWELRSSTSALSSMNLLTSMSPSEWNMTSTRCSVQFTRTASLR